MLTPFIANFINSVTLILFGLWGYLGSQTPSPTALIPVIFGVLLIAVSVLILALLLFVVVVIVGIFRLVIGVFVVIGSHFV